MAVSCEPAAFDTERQIAKTLRLRNFNLSDAPTPLQPSATSILPVDFVASFHSFNTQIFRRYRI